MTQFDQQYQQAIWEIMNRGFEVQNERTGHRLKALPGITFNLDNGFPVLTLRRIPVKLFVAEQIWFMMGQSNPNVFLNRFTKIWDDFTDQNGQVTAAYGYRWRHHFGRDQIIGLIKHLEREPGSRQAVVISWDPADDGLGTFGSPKKNVPCPFAFTVNVLGNQLHIHNIIRSNDMILGCPHDVSGFALLQRFLAARLGLKPGRLTHSISNAHIYDIHYEAAWEMLERQNDHRPIELDPADDWFERAERGDEGLVKEIVDRIQLQYHPMDPIKDLKIVL